MTSLRTDDIDAAQCEAVMEWWAREMTRVRETPAPSFWEDQCRIFDTAPDTADDAERNPTPLVHPCGHCGQREGAGAAGLCRECFEASCAVCGADHDTQACPDAHVDPEHGLVCPHCGEEMADDHYQCEAAAGNECGQLWQTGGSFTLVRCRRPVGHGGAHSEVRS